MEGIAFLERARAQGLRVESTGDQLEIRGPRKLASLAKALLAKKEEVLWYVRVTEVLPDLRSHLPPAMARMSDDDLLALCNWHLFVAWDRTVGRLEGRDQ